MGEITQLLERARAGESAAWEQVVGLLYNDLMRIARRATPARGVATLNATALVNECYLWVARGQAEGISSSSHFLALASRAMRQILANYARDRVAAKRGGGALRVTLDDMQIAANQEADDVLQLDDALSRLAKEDARLSQVVDCRVFGGLSETETAEALGMSLRTVQRLWQQARDRLKDTLQASE